MNNMEDKAGAKEPKWPAQNHDLNTTECHWDELECQLMIGQIPKI